MQFFNFVVQVFAVYTTYRVLELLCCEDDPVWAGAFRVKCLGSKHIVIQTGLAHQYQGKQYSTFWPDHDWYLALCL